MRLGLQRVIAVIFSAFLFSCESKETNELFYDAQLHDEELNQYFSKRFESLKSETGWLNLVGLEWISIGESLFGTGDNAVVKVPIEGFPEQIGYFSFDGEKVFFTPIASKVKDEESFVEEKVLMFDEGKSIDLSLKLGQLKWNIIKRSDAFGVRIRDLESESVKVFDGVPRFPIAPEWKIQAKFHPHPEGKTIMITNILGQTTPNANPGYIEFEKDGEIFRLEALDAGDQLYLIFADDTSGAETYGGGRYLYVKKPTSGNQLIVDFNKAYNPPCVFSPHATCPLPPRENILAIAIKAGEKTFGEIH